MLGKNNKSIYLNRHAFKKSVAPLGPSLHCTDSHVTNYISTGVYALAIFLRLEQGQLDGDKLY